MQRNFEELYEANVNNGINVSELESRQVLSSLQETPASDQEVRHLEAAQHTCNPPQAVLLQPILERQARHFHRLSHTVDMIIMRLNDLFSINPLLHSVTN